MQILLSRVGRKVMNGCVPPLKECELELDCVCPDTNMAKVDDVVVLAKAAGGKDSTCNIMDDEARKETTNDDSKNKNKKGFSPDSILENSDILKSDHGPSNEAKNARHNHDSNSRKVVAMDQDKDCSRPDSSAIEVDVSTGSDSEYLENGHDEKTDYISKPKKSPVKHLIAIMGFSLVSLLMAFTYLRIAMHALCPYDENLKTYIVMEKVEQCPVPIDQEEYYDDNSCPFWKTCPPPLAPEDFVRFVPAPAGKRHEMLCRDIYNILHFGAMLLHPNVISYKRTMPSVQIHSPCPKFPPPLKKKRRSLWRRLLLSFRKKEKNQGTSTEEIPSSDGFDWTLYVSSPLNLDLSSDQRALAKQVTLNLKSNLMSKYPDQAPLHNSWFEQKVEQVPFGGKYSWWHPSKDKWGDDKEESGLRLVSAYLKIMNWPKNLSTNFPFSGLCDKGCPADFAISNTLEFREEYQPWKITPSVVHENRKGWVYVRGYSPTRYHPDPAVGGASVLWMRPGLHKMENAESFSRAVIHAVETCIADALMRSGGKLAKCNIVLDCDDVGLSKIPPIGLAKRTLKMLQDHYPDKLGTFAITNLSGASQMFLKVLLPLLPDIVRQKIHIIPNVNEDRSKMLKALINEEFIPIQFGGVDEYKFHPKEYYMNGRYKAEMMTEEEGIRYYRTIPFYGP